MIFSERKPCPPQAQVPAHTEAHDMALTKADLAALATLIDERIAASRPTRAASPAREFPFAQTHACTADEPCGRMLRTAKRASTHGSEGHFPPR